MVRFKGIEGFSRCYEFEIDLVSTDAEIDLDQVLMNPATFTILREDGDIPFHGMLSGFEQLHSVDEYVFYRALLVPRLWWLSITRHNQIFLDKTVPEMIEAVLKDGGLTSLDFELRLRSNYPKWEYVCQYGESHLAFVSRWMEREGMYYYFEQNQGSEKVIVTDTRMAHTEMAEGKTVYYSPPSALDELHREEVIKVFKGRQTMVPRSLRLKDVNYLTPSLELTGKAEVSPKGRGEVYLYGEHFLNPEQGDGLARIRAEEFLCRQKRYHGESTIPYLRPGYLFELQDHDRGDFNQSYLTVDLTHEGSQTAYLLAGIQKGLSEVETQPYYRNRFAAISGDVQFRPERKTEKPRFLGTMTAKIDAAGSGKYAELDEHGRYKVVLQYDESGRKEGKASSWFRMAQPYAGSDHGMHFPLHKGTEVLLTFLDGDPDRPVITGALPNAEMPSQVASGDQTMAKITTAGGNTIHMEDQEGTKRILLRTPTANTWMRLGAPNDPDDTGPTEDDFDEHVEMTEEETGFKISGEGSYVLYVGAGKMEIIIGLEQKINAGNVFETVGGLNESVNVFAPVFAPPPGLKLEVTVILAEDFKVAGGLDFSKWVHGLKEEELEINGQKIEGSIGKLTINGGDITLNGNGTKVTGNDTAVAGNVSKVKGENTEVTGNATKLCGKGTEVRGNATEVKGNYTNVTGAATEVHGNDTTVTGNATEVNGSDTVVAGSVAKVSASDVSVRGNATKAAALIARY